MTAGECRTADAGGIVAALPLAAAATLLAARLLPVRFAYHENTLGIVSLATRARYPQQQELFWLVFSLGLATLLVRALAPALRAPSPSRGAGVEAAGTVALLGLLWLPTWIGVGLAAAACTTALGLAAAARSGAPVAWPALPASPPDAARGRRLALYAAASLAVALALHPNVWTGAWNVLHGVPDELRVSDDFVFQGHVGQHLAWADALRRGGLHGRDFFCLYGPLYDLGLVGFWALLGRSIASWDLYFALTRMLGFAAVLWLGCVLTRRRALVLLLPFLVPYANLRTGWALLGLVALHGWLRGRRPGWAVAAGVLAGAALLYSQEFGLAFAVTSALAFAVARAPRAALGFAGGAALVTLPLLGWYASAGALAPMLSDLAGYPGYMLAGYGKLPFPALASALPIDPARWRTPELMTFRLGYVLPCIGLGALLLALPVTALDPRRPLASARTLVDALEADAGRLMVVCTAVFALLCFRTALGRSDVQHMIEALPAAAVLFVVGCDRVAAQWSAARAVWPRPLWPLPAWRSLALALVFFHGGFQEAAFPLRSLRQTAAQIASPGRYAAHATGNPRVSAVARWIRMHTEPSEPVLFLPNDAAYYYLSDRPAAIRFVMGHQMVTDAHRREVLERLRRDPPRFVVWDDAAVRVDGLDDELVFGPELLAWIDSHYDEERRFGPVRILRRRDAPLP